jgi:hypothetical protein
MNAVNPDILQYGDEIALQVSSEPSTSHNFRSTLEIYPQLHWYYLRVAPMTYPPLTMLTRVNIIFAVQFIPPTWTEGRDNHGVDGWARST